MQKADAPENLIQAIPPATSTNPQGQLAHNASSNLNKPRNKGNKMNNLGARGSQGGTGNSKNLQQGGQKGGGNNRFQRPNNSGNQSFGERKWDESQNGGPYKMSEVF